MAALEIGELLLSPLIWGVVVGLPHARKLQRAHYRRWSRSVFRASPHELATVEGLGGYRHIGPTRPTRELRYGASDEVVLVASGGIVVAAVLGFWALAFSTALPVLRAAPFGATVVPLMLLAALALLPTFRTAWGLGRLGRELYRRPRGCDVDLSDLRDRANLGGALGIVLGLAAMFVMFIGLVPPALAFSLGAPLALCGLAMCVIGANLDEVAFQLRHLRQDPGSST